MVEETMNAFSPPKANLEGGAVEAGAQRLAERGTRFAAILLDIVVFLPVAIIAGVAIALTSKGANGQPPGAGFAIAVGLASLAGLALFIYQIVLLSTKGQTLGKRWMKIRIVKLDGSMPGFVHAVLLRMWVNGLICGIPYLGAIYSLVDILFVFREDRRCIHDLIASTRVIVAE
jgi:uncharacterized RDD family membrane protein YckC